MMAHGIGFLGMACVVTAYFMITEKRWTTDAPIYHWINLAGAVLLLVSLLVHFNLGSFIIEVFWIGIALRGLLKAGPART